MIAAYPAKLNAIDYIKAAKRLGCDVSSVRAVAEVEARGTGFVLFEDEANDIYEWRPKILFERHVMRKRYQEKYGYDATMDQIKLKPDVINTRDGGYIGGAAEHRRLAKARTIDKYIGLESASWGIFQIMGYHWQQLGYKSAVDFVLAMSVDEAAHLDAFVRFIENNKSLLNAIRSKDWALFARVYNGSGYAKNKYDVKMRQAEKKYRDQGVNEPICYP